MPGIFEQIFNRGEKPATSHDLKIALRGCERGRKRKQQEMRRGAAKANILIQNLKAARKTNNKEEVDYLWEELQQNKLDISLTKRESKILRLEAMALKRYSRALERLEKTGNKARVEDLIQRIKNAGLDDALGRQQIEEDDYLDRLNQSLDEMKDTLEFESGSLEETDSTDKTDFLQSLDEIIAAEESGHKELATERQEKLKSKLEPSES